MTAQAEIKTDRLLLRPFRIEDVDDVFAYANDAEWVEFLGLDIWPYTRLHAEEFVTLSLGTPWDTEPHFAITLNDVVLGGVRFVINPRKQVASLGYGIKRDHWGKGLVPEATGAAMDWVFKNYQIHKVMAQIDARNERSCRVAEKLGMTREGLLRGNRLKQGVRSDELVYGILREEWDAHRSR